MDRDFGTLGTLGNLLEALLVASRCPVDRQGLKIDAKSPFDANLSFQLAFGAGTLNGWFREQLRF